MIDEDRKKLEAHLKSIVRHINEVQKNCSLLAEKIIDLGGDDNFALGRELIANSFLHDNSKLTGIEWKYLLRGEEFLQLAHEQHVTTNQHHPEYWTSKGMTIDEMPTVYVAEMVCDWKSRSSEFGTDLRSWVKDVAFERYGIRKNSKKYKEVRMFLDMLLEEPF